jgi:hypothetical protein
MMAMDFMQLSAVSYQLKALAAFGLCQGSS